MANWVVGPDPGDDFTTISAAVVAPGTGNGDTIEVKAGTYNESVPNGGLINLTIQAHASAATRPIVDGTALGGLAINADAGWLITGLEVQQFDPGGGGASAAIEGTAVVGSRFTVRDVYIHDCCRGVRYIVGAGVGTESLVEDCFIKDMAEYGIIALSHVNIRNNLLKNAGTFYGIDMGAIDNLVTFNTVVDVAGLGGIRCPNAADNEVYSNLVVADAAAPGARGIELGGTIALHRTNYVYGAFSSVGIGTVIGTDLSNLSETVSVAPGDDPLFDDPLSDDYHLAYASPCFGRGGYVIGITDDRDGVTRGTTPYTTLTVDFDGTNDYVEVDNVADDLIGSSFTVSAWAKTLGTVNQMVFAFNTAAGGNAMLMMVRNNGMDWASDAPGWLGSPTRDVNDGWWHHLVWTFDVGVRRVTAYVDGTLEWTAIDAGASAIAPTDTVQIGMEYDGAAASDWFAGQLDEVSVWNKALSGPEVAEIYNSGAPMSLAGHSAFASLLSWWRMGEGDAFPTLTDSAAGTNDGTMTLMVAGDIVASDLVPEVEPGCYEIPDALSLDSASAPTATTVLCEFNLPPTASTVNHATDWTITPVGLGATVTVLSATVQVDTKQVLLAVYPEMTAGATYLATALNASSPVGPASPSTAQFTVAAGLLLSATGEFALRMLPALLHGMGQELQVVAGHVATRLTAVLEATDTTALVESTLAMAASGAMFVLGLRFTYTSKTAGALHGLVADRPRLLSVPAGTEVHFDPLSVSPGAP